MDTTSARTMFGFYIFLLSCFFGLGVAGIYILRGLAVAPTVQATQQVDAHTASLAKEAEQKAAWNKRAEALRDSVR